MADGTWGVPPFFAAKSGDRICKYVLSVSCDVSVNAVAGHLSNGKYYASDPGRRYDNFRGSVCEIFLGDDGAKMKPGDKTCFFANYLADMGGDTQGLESFTFDPTSPLIAYYNATTIAGTANGPLLLELRDHI